jgi:hypothetical protein
MNCTQLGSGPAKDLVPRLGFCYGPRMRFRRRLRIIGWMILGLWMCLSSARAQIDPVDRQMFQLGYNQPLQGRGPIAGYAFYYLNKPTAFNRTNLTFRLAVAPVFLDSQLGIKDVLGPDTDLAVGLEGGGFADSFAEMRRGRFVRGESFVGHGGGTSLSLFHRFNPDSRIPLNAILRGGFHYAAYGREDRTDPTFELPDDLKNFSLRTGLRWGGRAPVLFPKVAMELSIWHETLLRGSPSDYGFGNDRTVNDRSHLFWTRGLLYYTLPEKGHQFSFSVTLGTSTRADRLSAYRMGGFLPLIAEFPLNIPGYYAQEITATDFALLNGFYSIPLDHDKNWFLAFMVGSAVVDYLPGLQQSGDWHTGVGGGIRYRSPNRAWQIALGYGYGFNAIRKSGRGAHSIGILLQYDFDLGQPLFDPGLPPSQWRGFDRLFGR